MIKSLEVPMRAHRAFAALALAATALATAGCSGDDGADEPTQDAADEQQEVADEPVADAADDTSDDAADVVSTASEPVDVCGLFTSDDFAAVYGVAPAASGESLTAQGSLLGGCSYAGPDGEYAMIQARPATEWEGTVAAYGGAPAAAASMDTSFEASIGLLAAFDGQPWFAHIMAGTDPGVWDETTSVGIAEAIAAHL